MPLAIGWTEIAFRLFCAVMAGVMIGFDRGEHGRPAGLRTTILVSAAACFAMIEANLLLPTAGKVPDSFVVMDLMRFPLGILSGMGFIGAGAIVHRGDMAQGVTTAATLWFVTMLGLCFGGGQIGLGCAGTGIGIVVLTALRPLDRRIPRKHRGTLSVTVGRFGPDEEEIRAGLGRAQYHIDSSRMVQFTRDGKRELTFRVNWQDGLGDGAVPPVVRRLAQQEGIEKVAWTSQAT